MTMNFPLLLLLFALNASDDVPAPSVHPNVKHKGRRIEAALVLPARVNIVQQGIRGANSMPDLEEDIARRLSVLVSAYLASKGVKILPAASGDDESEAVRHEQAEMQRRYDVLDAQIVRKPNGVSKGRFALGDSVAAYGSAAAGDSIVFIRGRATVLDKAQKVIGSVPGPWMWGAKDQTFEGRIVVVDSRSGDVLLFVPFTTYGHGWKLEVDELLPRIQDSMRRMQPSLADVLGVKGK